MDNTILYSFLSIFFVSLISFIGLLTLSIKYTTLRKILIYFISFSSGALLGDAFIHLLPKVTKESGFSLEISLYLLFGIIFSFMLEKFIIWRHHRFHHKERVASFTFMNLFGDGIHNFIDGLVIGASYLVSITTGLATTLAVIFHEIPQEIGDFGVLLKGGLSKKKALFYNFLSALTAFLGGLVSILIGSKIEDMMVFLISFAAGTFIYIAGTDLIPELHKEIKMKISLLQLLIFILGVLVMLSLVLLE